MPSRSSTTPNLSSKLRIPNSLQETSSAPRTADDRSFLSQTFVRAHWLQGLTQYSDFRLHAALSTFKRLLRDLRSTNDELPSHTTSDDAHGESPPYRILLPGEVALLYINIALIHGYLGSYYMSAAAFEEALLLDDLSSIAWFGLGIAKFYLRELGASKRAFGRCQACFVTQGENGTKTQRESLTYKIWIGHTELNQGPPIANENNDPKSASSPWQPFKSVLGRSFPDGLWMLERPRVEWNWRIALFERNYVRKGVERPGGGKWGLNGIPVGVIFGPGSHIESEATFNSQIGDSGLPREGSGLADSTHPGLVGETKGRTRSLVRQKWNLLQQKVLRKKSSTATSATSLRSLKSLEPTASSHYSNEKSEKVTSGQAFGHHHEIPREPLPLTQHVISHQARSLSVDDTEEAEMQSSTGPGAKATHEMAPMFPPRRSSLILPFTRLSHGPHRSWRSSLYAINTKVQDIGSIQEEPMEGDFTDPWVERPVVGEHVDPDLNGVSPKDTREYPNTCSAPPDSSVLTERAEDLTATDVMSGYNAVHPLGLTMIPPTATSSRYGSDSFMTDNISPLSSCIRSVMFPPFSDRHSSSERRRSYAMDVWNASSDTAALEEYEDRVERQPSTIVTLTPATPERSGELPVTANLCDSYHLASSSFDLQRSSYLEGYLKDEGMAVAPLHVTKKERMSITGRTCLGEWEWEEQYERWREESSLATNADDDDDDTNGEMLLPRRFEGFDEKP
ncbi:MAG: hypothetical protein Q9225_006152 [Loekoesia sp. 1 TL-2023]